ALVTGAATVAGEGTDAVTSLASATSAGVGTAVSVMVFLRSLLRDLRDLRNLVWLGLLRLVRVLGTGIDLELADHLTAQAVVRDHAFDGQLDGALGVFGQELLVGGGPQTARVAGVAVGEFGRTLVTGQRHLGGVDDDHKVAGVDVRREHGLVLAAQKG